LKKRTQINKDIFISETSEFQRRTLEAKLIEIIIYYTNRDQAVYLEDFGIFKPILNTKYVTYKLNDFSLLREETTRTITFEKCDLTSSFDSDDFPNLVDISRLTKRIYPMLPIEINSIWTKQCTRRYLRGLIKDIKFELIDNGITKRFKEIGTLAALNNSSNLSFSDSYHSSQIFLLNPYKTKTAIGNNKKYKEAVFKSAWSPFQAAYGKEKLKFYIDIEKELSELGYDISELKNNSDISLKLPVSVFEKTNNKKTTLIYVTNGLRKYGIKENKLFGNEFVFQLPIKQELNTEDFTPPLWPIHPITLAWILMFGTKSKAIKPGVMFSTGTSLYRQSDCSLDTILTTEYEYFKHTAKSESGSFKYLNLVGINYLEADIARTFDADLLIELLKAKGLDQETKSQRNLITNNTVLKKIDLNTNSSASY